MFNLFLIKKRFYETNIISFLFEVRNTDCNETIAFQIKPSFYKLSSLWSDHKHAMHVIQKTWESIEHVLFKYFLMDIFLNKHKKKEYPIFYKVPIYVYLFVYQDESNLQILFEKVHNLMLFYLKHL